MLTFENGYVAHANRVHFKGKFLIPRQEQNMVKFVYKFWHAYFSGLRSTENIETA